jgi:hypothetical protein
VLTGANVIYIELYCQFSLKKKHRLFLQAILNMVNELFNSNITISRPDREVLKMNELRKNVCDIFATEAPFIGFYTCE